MPKNNYGTEALELLDQLVAHHKWLYQQIDRHIGKRVIEVGAGRGHLTQFYFDRTELLWLTEIEPDCLDLLKSKYNSSQYIVESLDLATPPPLEPYHSKEFDTVLSSNVLEHLEDDEIALAWFSSILPPKGRLILILPSHQFLYGAIDDYYGHFRRYNDSMLRRSLEQKKFKIIESFYFGKLGAVAWFFKGRIFRQAVINSKDIAMKNALFWLATLVEKINLPFGHNLIMVAEKI